MHHEVTIELERDVVSDVQARVRRTRVAEPDKVERRSRRARHPVQLGLAVTPQADAKPDQQCAEDDRVGADPQRDR